MIETSSPTTSSYSLRSRAAIRRYALNLVSVLVLLGSLFFNEVAIAAPSSFPGYWVPTGVMGTGRQGPTMTKLLNGLVLVAGGCSTGGVHIATAELYNFATHTFSATGSMTTPRCAQTATLLPNGQVLVAGGSDSNGLVLSSAELYNPKTGAWTLTGSMANARSAQTATLLPSGEVLVAGGTSDSVNGLSSAELYNPQTGTWTSTSAMHTGRWSFTATLLQSGKVLVAGGLPVCVPGNCAPNNIAELYDPTTGTWLLTGNLPTPLYQQAASRLLNGQVLFSGGSPTSCPNVCVPTANAEIYNPSTGQWSLTAPMHTARENHTSTLLRSGQVLVAGGAGADGTALAAVERFDPSHGTWSTASNMTTNRAFHAAMLLPTGTVLVAGGCDTTYYDDCTDSFNTGELYVP